MPQKKRSHFINKVRSLLIRDFNYSFIRHSLRFFINTQSRPAFRQDSALMLACTVEARVLLSRTTLGKNLNASLTASAVGKISANHLPFLTYPCS